ncbi:MAG: AAA family ATPase [Thermodesulfobacteriota bacterium]
MNFPRVAMPKNPFRDTIDTDLFFRTRQHEEAVIKLRCGIEDGHALVLLTGQSGTGKTLVSQVVLRSLDPALYDPVVVSVHPGMGKGGLLDALLLELQEGDGPRQTAARIGKVQEQALARHAGGKRLVVVIDEAHFLQADALHLLRTLSNLETESDKLITVLLISEDVLRRRLKGPSYASLRGRITFAVQLAPLTRQETEQMIKYRLLKCKAPLGFVQENAYDRIFQLSGGVPREVNRLLYNAYLEASTDDRAAIDSAVVSQAAEVLV